MPTDPNYDKPAAFVGFRKNMRVTIVREKYEVGFSNGMTVAELQSLLNQVPIGAVVDEVLTGTYSTDPASIVFHYEAKGT